MMNKKFVKILLSLFLAAAMLTSLAACEEGPDFQFGHGNGHDPDDSLIAGVTTEEPSDGAEETALPDDPETTGMPDETEAPAAENTDAAAPDGGTSDSTQAPATETKNPAEGPHEHSYTSSVKYAATCTEKGLLFYECSCGDTYYEDVKETGHRYTPKVVAPTETEKGYTLYTCSECGDSYKTDYTPATGSDNSGHTHSYNSTVTTQPRCGVKGVRTYKCSCGDSYTEDILALEHVLDKDKSKTKEPTCTEAGSNTYKCMQPDCNYTYVETIPAKGHDWHSTTVHHDAVYGEKDVTEEWTRHTGVISFWLTDSGIEAGLGNKAEFAANDPALWDWVQRSVLATSTKNEVFYVKIYDFWQKGDDISTREYLYRWPYHYFDEKLPNGYTWETWYDNSTSQRSELTRMHQDCLQYYTLKYGMLIFSGGKWIQGYLNSYVSAARSIKEIRTVGTENDVIIPAYDETITTCSVCGKKK